MAGFKFAESYFWRGMLVTMVLLASKVLVEQVDWSHRLEAKTYELLMSKVFNKPADLPRVVVLDISNLPGGRQKDGTLVPTSRKDLLNLIRAMVPIQPKAIGIDIDFAPTRAGLPKGDPEFFDECLEISGHIPIKLGVFRTIPEPSDGWLGVEDYRSLAAAVWLPKDHLDRLPVWVSGTAKDSERMPSMGAALATAAYPHGTLPEWAAHVLGTAVERRVLARRVDEGLRIADRLMDHSFNDAIWNERIERVTPEKIAANAALLAESIVILGDTVSARERFEDPRGKAEVRTGVIFHAATAQTLAANDLFEFSGGFRYVLDILISVAAVSTMMVLVRRKRLTSEHEIESYELRVILLSALVLTLIAAALLFSPLRILWLDFIVVFGLLLLHLPMGAVVAKLTRQTKHDQPEKPDKPDQHKEGEK